MDPADSSQLSRVWPYSGAEPESLLCRVRDYHPLWSYFPERFCYRKLLSLRAIEGSSVLQPQRDESRWFGLMPFRSPLLRQSRLLSSPEGTEMFQFPSFATCTYGFSTRHSGISGSMLVWQLPRAYRSLPRPSSPPGAKTSPTCP